jgi:hypothetical protein
MTEKAIVVVINPEDMHCLKCFYGHQIIAGVAGKNIEDDGTETRWHLTRTIPVGQTRNCFSRLQRILGTAGEKFIYLEEDDSCINPKKFKPK